MTVGDGDSAIEPNMLINEKYNLDARKMLANGMDATTVMEITGLSESQVQQLKG